MTKPIQRIHNPHYIYVDVKPDLNVCVCVCAFLGTVEVAYLCVYGNEAQEWPVIKGSGPLEISKEEWGAGQGERRRGVKGSDL